MRRHEGEPGSGELNIVPFLDIVTNLMLFLLATTSLVVSVSEVRADLRGYGHRASEDVLNLSVTLTERGAVMTTSRGRIGPSCTSDGASAPTAARTSTGYDFAALARCAATLHAEHPGENSVILAADPSIPYSDLIAAMDALRANGETPLFPDVRISAGVR